jgi:hypothetical protein
MEAFVHQFSPFLLAILGLLGVYIMSFYLPSSFFYLFVFGIFELGTYNSLWLLAKRTFIECPRCW